MMAHGGKVMTVVAQTATYHVALVQSPHNSTVKFIIYAQKIYFRLKGKYIH
jgi:hypothetical protein